MPGTMLVEKRTFFVGSRCTRHIPVSQGSSDALQTPNHHCKARGPAECPKLDNLSRYIQADLCESAARCCTTSEPVIQYDPGRICSMDLESSHDQESTNFPASCFVKVGTSNNSLARAHHPDNMANASSLH